ncbi:aldose 1-epimerase-like isoform X2 [Punica granatum]|uniref:Aldose 1-epimerase-like isoform X2 n=1 Tax=Punica granatum TaxID=22663 RepID=A0A6P8BSN8_PUNGR|nr:aldose 1-epimerase-like isoform X2 [Punica granatum]
MAPGWFLSFFPTGMVGSGNLADIVLGYDTVDKYKNDSAYFGAIVGRVANRIGGAQFTLNGEHYKLVANERNNTLHGGRRGFSDVVWTVKSYEPDSYITFTYDSYDGEQGFPGDLSVSVTFLLIETNKLGIKMEAKALKKATPVNLALHTYWNLGGHNSGNILSHEIQLFASRITPVDSQLIPTGQISDIKGSAYDFLQPRDIGSQINKLPAGYDINYVLDGHGHEHLNKVAVLREKMSGREMELWSNQVGVQFYTGNYLDNVKGKGGFVYSNHSGLCLETQGFPDSVNHPNFPSQIINPGETYKHVMIFRFTA